MQHSNDGSKKKSCPCGGAAKNEGCQYKKRNGRLMEMKSFPFELEKINDAGEFKGFLSTHGNIDEGDDRFNFGAWKRTLTIQKGKRFPWLHVHKLDNQTGSFTAEETKDGLYIDGKLNLMVYDLGRGNNVIAVPKALEQYALMSNGDAKTMSVGYRVTGKGFKYTTENGRTIRDIYEAELFEGSLTAIPMNKMAVLKEVKEINNFSRESIIDYLMKHINDAELWERIMEIKGYDPEQYFHADPVPEIIPHEKNTFSTYGLFEKKVLEKYRSLI